MTLAGCCTISLVLTSKQENYVKHEKLPHETDDRSLFFTVEGIQEASQNQCALKYADYDARHKQVYSHDVYRSLPLSLHFLAKLSKLGLRGAKGPLEWKNPLWCTSQVTSAIRFERFP